LSGRNSLGNGISYMGKLHRTTRQKHHFYVTSGKSRLLETYFYPRRDAICQLFGATTKIGARNDDT